MENENVVSVESVKRLLRVFKRNILLIIATIIAVTAIGAVYSYRRPYVYSACEMAVFKGKYSDSVVLNDYTITNYYIDTFIDFCDEQCVVDRANYYYAEYLKSGGGDVTEYVNGLKTENKYKGAYDFGDFFSRDFKNRIFAVTVHSPENLYGRDVTKILKFDGSDGELLVFSDSDGKTVKIGRDDFVSATERIKTYISVSDVSASFSKSKTDDTYVSFTLNVFVKDTDPDTAAKKAKIYVQAIDDEVKNNDVEYGGFGEYRYFGAKLSVSDLGYVGTTRNFSRITNVVISFVIGVVIALVLAYVCSLFDRTIKNKEELENLVGASILAVIGE